MSKIFDLDFRKGSLIANYPNILPDTYVYSNFCKYTRGYSVKFNNSQKTTYKNIKLSNLTLFSVIIAVTGKYSISDSGFVLNAQTSINNITSIALNPYQDGSIFVNLNYNQSGYAQIPKNVKQGDQHICVIFDGTNPVNNNRVKMYLNSLPQTLSLSTIPSSIIKGNQPNFSFYGASNTGVKWYYVKVFDHVLTQEEITNDYSNFLLSKPLQIAKTF